MKDKLTYIYPAIQLLSVVYLLWVTLLPVEARWAEGDMLLMQGSMAVCCIGLTAVLRGAKPRVTLTDGLVMLWMAYYVGRVYIGGEYACATDSLKTASMCVLYYSLRALFHDTRLSAWWLVAGIILCGCCESLMGLRQMIEGTSRHPVFALTGTFQNPGPYSAYLMTGPVIGIVAWQESREKTLDMICPQCFPERLRAMLRKITAGQLVLFASLPMAMMLPTTWSRAAIVSISVIALWLFRHTYRRYRYAVWGACIIIATALYIIKQGSADGRVIIWHAALTTWSDTPWLGVGTGGFRHAVAEGMSTLHAHGANLAGAGVTDYSYNILLKILVEQGVVGMLIAVPLSIIALTRLRHTSRPLFYGMVSLVIFSMFSYPFELLPYKVILVLTAAWSESQIRSMQCGIGRAKATLLTGMVLLGSWYIHDKVRERYEADTDYSLFRGLQDEAFLKDYYELRPLEHDNADFLFDFGKALRHASRYNDSNAMLREGARCSADPMFHVLIGNNYKDMQQYALAGQAYRKAFAIMPNRLYPLYQLMLLYEEQGDRKKAKAVAQHIIDMKPKVESPATREMKEKARAIMNDEKIEQTADTMMSR